ncbi:MAG: hypothetical protein DCE90_13620 [Pseudanabaena sp.]|nr:MAG: hypothetical protein DCE90_13620 [Pseudanabaena sp.]
MSESTNSPINLELLKQISEGDTEFEIEVLQVYVEDNCKRIEEIREAIASKRYLEITQAAHHIKGASGNVGATQLLNLSTILEKMEHPQEPSLVNEIVEQMLEAMQDVKIFLREIESQG